MANIHLLGTIHCDFNGARRLERALQVEKPEILTVEGSQQWFDCLAEHWDQDIKMFLDTMKKRGFNQQTFSFFENYLKSVSNYEFDTCKAYSNQMNIPLHLIDDPGMVDFLRQEILSQSQAFLESVDPKVVVLRESVIRGHDAIYQDIQDLYDGEIPAIVGEQQIIDPQRGKLIGKRDKTEARNLTELAQNNDVKIVHVGGNIHNLTDSRSETLYSRLAKFNPSRTTLFAYDK
jgi:pheromone shutdown protein TraB